MAVVLDTHAALWWNFFPEKVSRQAKRAIEHAEQLWYPSIVFWETSLLVRKGRIRLPISSTEWLRGLHSTERAHIVPLSAEIAVRADGLRMHEDPADRFIVATALENSLPLVTRDAAIANARVVKTVW